MVLSYRWFWRTFMVYLVAMLVGFLLSMFGVITMPDCMGASGDGPDSAPNHSAVAGLCAVLAGGLLAWENYKDGQQRKRKKWWK
jgi:uncharacterized membrane protein